MKVIIIHSLLWTHYRNKIYSELHQQAGNNFDIKVLQIARNERSRASMENNAQLSGELNYNYDLLFDSFIEDIDYKALFWKLYHKINEFRPEVVNLVGYYLWPQTLILIYCHFKGIKVILSNDSTAMDNEKVWWKTILKRYLVSLCSGFFNFGTLATKYIKSLGAKEEQMLANRCATVDNNFIKKAYQEYLPQRSELQREFAVSPKNFIFVGRFIEIKNLFVLLNAFHKATKEKLTTSSEWGLMLLGDGIEKEPLQDFIAKNNIENVHFIAGKPWYEIPKFLTMADVFVLPSKSEPWGLVVNEAMICKMPVIVSDKCGCSIDLVKENQNGYIFPYNEVNTLKMYLEKFMNNEVNMKEMGNLSSEIINDFAPEKVAESMLAGFKKVVNKI